ncbi:hypothetical protein BH24ACT16_BH24ACT16_05920 [soil metagenome]|jgi:tRNA C32,U32 (ribose-2'-O)-methylase TrmJ
MISEDEVSTLYNMPSGKSYRPVNQSQAANVLNYKIDKKHLSAHDTVGEPHTGGGFSQNV